ncbi:MAG: hypothetical protein JXA82_07370 [Sedimentisphaerales bacterium]|nr:hypothetical protein [Sedimentisphaerales bacterium]
MSKRISYWVVLSLVSLLHSSLQAEPFSMGAVADIEIGNDPSLSPDASSEGSGLGARNIPDRRRVILLQYNLSQVIFPGEVFTNISFSNFGHDQDDPIDVYGVIESQDDLTPGTTVENLTWNTAPGVQNNPTPPLNDPVALDLADLEGPLMTFIPPAQGERASTDISDAVADFLNSDTDGTVIFLFAITVDGNQAIIRSSEHSAGGTLLEGETGPARAAFDPQPGKGSTVSVDLTQLCWTLPDPNIPGTILTSDVYFGTKDPNESLPGFGLERITAEEGIIETCIDIPIVLEQFETYYWVVDCYDPSLGEGEEFLAGVLWSFNTNNDTPSVDAGEDQYVWLNNAGDPATATIQIDATVTDDGLPSGALSVLWSQTSGPEVTIDPADVEDITLVLPETGTYQFQLTADDTDQIGADTIEIIVAETPCLAAQAMPGYEPILGDFDNDCIVSLNDLAELALHWLECNSLLCP